MSWDAKRVSEIIRNVMAAVGIIATGIWTITVFFLEGRHLAILDVKMSVEQINALPKYNSIVLRQKLDLHNNSLRPIRLSRGTTWAQQVLPLVDCQKVVEFDEEFGCTEQLLLDRYPKRDNLASITSPANEGQLPGDAVSWPYLKYNKFDWPEARQIRLDPNERDSLIFEYVVPKNLEVVRFYAFLQNERRNSDVWIWFPDSRYRKDHIGHYFLKIFECGSSDQSNSNARVPCGSYGWEVDEYYHLERN